jgi:predicted signal transduction protein with EAL and GGDEF domain
MEKTCLDPGNYGLKGTGYNLRPYVKSANINEMVPVLLNNDAAIVSVIVAIYQSLKLEVVAEGVENKSQLDFLLEKGCYLYQGYLFGKPVPIEEFIT